METIKHNQLETLSDEELLARYNRAQETIDLRFNQQTDQAEHGLKITEQQANNAKTKANEIRAILKSKGYTFDGAKITRRLMQSKNKIAKKLY